MIRPILLLSLAFFAICHQSFAWNGPIKTRNELCIERGFEGSCEKRHFGREYLNESIRLLTDYSCDKLRCARKKTGPKTGPFHFEAVEGGEVLDGSYCGSSSVCVEKQCVKLPKIAMPQYTSDPKIRILNCK